MEIRFCSVCNESIPDGEFDAGRAVVSGKRSQHVACALRRSVETSGLRSWLTFALALVAAAISVYLLVSKMSQVERKPHVLETAAGVEAHVQEAVDASERNALRLEAARNEKLRQGLAADFEGKLTDVLNSSVKAALEKQDERLRESNRQMHDRLSLLDANISKLREQVAQLMLWRTEIEKEAQRLSAELVALEKKQAARPPPAPVESPPTEDGGGEPTAEDVERDQEIERWRKRLRDPDEDIVFSATIELARLKALRATPDLVHVLNKHRDFYARLGAATALGEVQAAGGVADLIEALNDKDELVRTAASEALSRITQQDFNFVSGLNKNERIRIQKRWRAWWRDNEQAVRQRLNQIVEK
jgi:HEAT repeat protein